MFVIGLELQPSQTVGAAQVDFRLGLCAGCADDRVHGGGAHTLFSIDPGKPALVIGFALSMSSTALALQLLAERGQLNTQFGRSAFSILLFQDVSVLPALALLPLLGVAAAAPNGGGGWLVLKFIARACGRHRRRPLRAESPAAHRRRNARGGGIHGRGSFDRARNRTARQPSRPVAVAGSVPRRRAARRQRISPRIGGRHRALQGTAARSVLHQRRHVREPELGARKTAGDHRIDAGVHGAESRHIVGNRPLIRTLAGGQPRPRLQPAFGRRIRLRLGRTCRNSGDHGLRRMPNCWFWW